MEEQLITLLMFTIPALVTGAVAYIFFRDHLANEEERRKFHLLREISKESLPLRLQAYERLSLFLERISPNKLLIRVTPIGDSKQAYESLLINTIEQEFEHNLSQQIYLTDECWSIINASKNATIQLIRKSGMSDKIESAFKLRESILSDMIDQPAPSQAALHFIKKEVGEIWKR